MRPHDCSPHARRANETRDTARKPTNKAVPILIVSKYRLPVNPTPVAVGYPRTHPWWVFAFQPTIDQLERAKYNAREGKNKLSNLGGTSLSAAKGV
ncbi:MAG: hypothetical protein K8R46_02470, partial [Pirellulales bacterium]|nr:hypothetical protein [Pirellulales bacterium]